MTCDDDDGWLHLQLEWVELGWFGLSWVELGWFGLIWVELGWFGLSWVDLGWDGLLSEGSGALKGSDVNAASNLRMVN